MNLSLSHNVYNDRKDNPANNAGSMLVHRLRRWPNIKPALIKRVVFAENMCFNCWLLVITHWNVLMQVAR